MGQHDPESTPTFVLFDGDTNTDPAKADRVAFHKRDNKAILMLKDYDDANEWADEDVILEDLTYWKTNLTDTMKSEFGEQWTEYRNRASVFYENAGDLEKNPLAIGKLLELAWNACRGA